MSDFESSIFTQIANVCRKTLEQGGAGRVLAAKLGIHDERLLSRFKTGYAEATLLNVIPAKGNLRETLEEMGLIGKDGCPTILDCLVIPVLDREGRAIGIVVVDKGGRERRFPAALPLYGLNHQEPPQHRRPLRPGIEKGPPRPRWSRQPLVVPARLRLVPNEPAYDPFPFPYAVFRSRTKYSSKSFALSAWW